MSTATQTTTGALSLPRWDMSVVYPDLESAEFAAGFAALIQEITDLVSLFDTHQVDKQETPPPLDTSFIATFEAVVNRYNAVLAQLATMHSYIYSFVSTNTRDAVAQARLSTLQRHAVALHQLDSRFTAWIGSLDVEGLIARSPVAHAHTFALRKAREEARHLMSPAEEALAAELTLSAGTAWSKMYGNVSSQIIVPLSLNGQAQELPMAVVRTLAHDADRAVRQQAYEAELAAWERMAVPLAAALNSIKAEVNTLTRRRGWASPLDVALFDNNMDRQTLDAMMQTAHEFFPDLRRYLRAKARALGEAALPWYDLFAPIGASDRIWTYEDATAFVSDQFGTFSPRLRAFAERAFRENWVDAEPRAGKRDGAYCMLLRDDESRVFMNFKPSFYSVNTLAHELGHAYHNLNLATRTVLQKSTPMPLAETASTFCETIITHAALRHASAQEQLAILEASLQDACQVTVDITSRFIFEQGVFDTTRERELSVDELKELMLDAQRQTYGDGLDQNVLHPYMWAVKGHYYSAGRSFYNYPYMFGLLFGLGLYSLYQKDPIAFTAQYDELLSSTGLDDTASLALRFGIDIRSADFWRASFAVVRDDVDRFEALVAGTSP